MLLLLSFGTFLFVFFKSLDLLPYTTTTSKRDGQKSSRDKHSQNWPTSVYESQATRQRSLILASYRARFMLRICVFLIYFWICGFVSTLFGKKLVFFYKNTKMTEWCSAKIFVMSVQWLEFSCFHTFKLRCSFIVISLTSSTGGTYVLK